MAEMTQRQRLRVVAEMLFTSIRLSGLCSSSFFTSGKEKRGQPIACVAQDERQMQPALVHLAKSSVESVYEIVTRHNIITLVTTSLFYSTVMVT